jgi:hypothetical protein
MSSCNCVMQRPCKIRKFANQLQTINYEYTLYKCRFLDGALRRRCCFFTIGNGVCTVLHLNFYSVFFFTCRLPSCLFLFASFRVGWIGENTCKGRG